MVGFPSLKGGRLIPVAVALAAFGGWTTALACSCLPPEPEEVITRDVVVLAEVLSTGGCLGTRTRVQVIEAVQGAQAGDVLRTPTRPLNQFTSCDAEVTPGETIVLWSDFDDRDRVAISLCNYLPVPTVDDGRELLDTFRAAIP